MTETQNKKTNENVNPSSLEVSNDDAFGLWMKEKAQHIQKKKIWITEISSHSETRTRYRLSVLISSSSL